MKDGDAVFREIQRRARAIAAETQVPTPTAQLVTLHGLESFLDRLTHTEHVHNSILKGGVLLAAQLPQGTTGAQR